MVTNDYFDRVVDLRKGKFFAYNHSKGVLFYAIFLWMCVGVLIAFLEDFSCISLAVIQVFIAMLYVFLRKYYIINNIIVAICVASLILYASIYYDVNTLKICIIFLFLACIIFIREVVKDIEDVVYDNGAKPTIPLKLGILKAKEISVRIYIGTTCVTGLLFLLYNNDDSLIVASVITLQVITSLWFFYVRKTLNKQKIDLVLLCFLIILFISQISS